MQTRTYGDLFKLIQSLAGVSTFAPTETDDIANLINRRYSEAYNTIQMWPRYLVSSEARKIFPFSISDVTQNTQLNQVYENVGAATYAAGIGYDVYRGAIDTSCFLYKSQIVDGSSSFDAWVVQKDATQSSTGASPSGGTILFYSAEGFFNTDPSSITDWETTSESVGDTISVNAKNSIPYSQSGKTTIGEFIRIHRNKAFLNNSSLEYDFFVDAEGANILNISSTKDTSAFITYKKVFTPFTTSSNYTTSTEAVPGEFFHYIAHAAYSDFLRMDGQHDKAQLEQQNAQQYLALELERVDVIMNQNTVNKRFSTHVNRQSR